jgi:hypothetical protein
MSTEHIISVLKSMHGIQFLDEYWTSFESFIHKYIGYIWTLKVDDNIIIIPFSTSLTFKIYSFCWFYINNCKSVTYIISGFRIIWICLSSFPIQCLSCAFFICWSQVLFTHITEIPTDNLWSSWRYIFHGRYFPTTLRTRRFIVSLVIFMVMVQWILPVVILTYLYVQC